MIRTFIYHLAAILVSFLSVICSIFVFLSCALRPKRETAVIPTSSSIVALDRDPVCLLG